jgi:hypothetical protein
MHVQPAGTLGTAGTTAPLGTSAQCAACTQRPSSDANTQRGSCAQELTRPAWNNNSCVRRVEVVATCAPHKEHENSRQRRHGHSETVLNKFDHPVGDYVLSRRHVCCHDVACFACAATGWGRIVVFFLVVHRALSVYVCMLVHTFVHWIVVCRRTLHTRKYMSHTSLR